jgi:hypothetical protein
VVGVGEVGGMGEGEGVFKVQAGCGR